MENNIKPAAGGARGFGNFPGAFVAVSPLKVK